MADARFTVLNLLLKMENSNSYSNILLNSALDETDLSPKDKSFAAALFYGVTERKMTLDYVISQNSRMPLNKIQPEALNILRMGIYQLLYMPSVPDSAAVNEAVKLCKRMKLFGAQGFVNGLLRNFARNGKAVDYSELDTVKRLSIEYSCPEWIAKKLTTEYGEENTIKALKASLGAPPLFARVNSLKTDEEVLVAQLKKEGVKASVYAKLPGCIKLEGVGDLENLESFRNGLFHIQDISSQLCCLTLRPILNETVMDICAAPGGKSFTMAELMGNRGTLISMDLYEHRVGLIQSGAERLGLGIVDARVNNATRFNEELPMADRVLCDVPCSGLGVIRRKPEIKYKDEHEFDELPVLQKRILEISSKYVKPGGTIVYSTCTLSKAENDDVVQQFAAEHPEFMPIVQTVPYESAENSYMRTYFPDEDGGDGFFTASFRRLKD